MYHLAAVVFDEEQRENGAEQNVVELQEVAGPDLFRVVLEERRPGLVRRSGGFSDRAHVLLDRALAHRDAKLEQLAPDALGSPRVVLRHPLNQLDGLLRSLLGLSLGLGLEAPEQLEEPFVPAQQRVGLHDVKGLPPRGIEPGKEDHEQAVAVLGPRLVDRAPENDELLAQQGVLGYQLRGGPGHVTGRSGRQRHRRGCGLRDLLDRLTGNTDPTDDILLHGGDDAGEHGVRSPFRMLG
jgi:hypothetical protein